MPPTTSYEFGDVLLVPFPFTDQSGTKNRPAVVISSQRYNHRRQDLILMPISTQQRAKPGIGEVTLAEWKAAGLLWPSVTKPILFTLEKNLIVRKIARLEPADCAAIRTALGVILG